MRRCYSSRTPYRPLVKRRFFQRLPLFGRLDESEVIFCLTVLNETLIFRSPPGVRWASPETYLLCFLHLPYDVMKSSSPSKWKKNTEKNEFLTLKESMRLNWGKELTYIEAGFIRLRHQSVIFCGNKTSVMKVPLKFGNIIKFENCLKHSGFL